MIEREIAPCLVTLFKQYPFVTVTGPRQSGKTTLCRAAFPHLDYVNLEAPDQREFAETDPRGFLARLGDGAILDEIQRVPDLLSYLQVEADGKHFPPKCTIALAHRIATGEFLSSDRFSGGKESNDFLVRRVINVVECGGGGVCYDRRPGSETVPSASPGDDRLAKLAARLRHATADHPAWPRNPRCTNTRTGPVTRRRSPSVSPPTKDQTAP